VEWKASLKRKCYDLLPPGSFPTTFNVLPSENIETVLKEINLHKIDFPLIVKPEMGGQGILFRKIDNPEELQHYHDLVPVEYIVQRMVHYPMEVSVFLYQASA
jgi:carbamoylphosphate synthase large subunit